MTIRARFRIKREGFQLDVDLAIPGVGVTVFFGPSGCGKTTLLRAIAGLEHAQDGCLSVGDQIWQGPGTFLPPHQRPIGYVFQEASLFAHLNVQRNLEYGLKRIRNRPPRISLEHAVALLDIGHLLRRKPHQLSGGEQQRIAIARALAVSPEMLLLDEPLAALDQRRKREILPYLEALNRELDIPVLYVSHSRSEVARLADHMVMLEDGQVQAAGPVDELFSRLDLALAHEPDTKSVVEAVVAEHDDRYKLTYLDFAGGRFAVDHRPLEPGSRVRLQVFARDVSLALSCTDRSSILNTFPAVVEQLVEEGPSQVTVRLSLGTVPLLSRITRRSALELGLEPGVRVYAQAKSVALMA